MQAATDTNTEDAVIPNVPSDTDRADTAKTNVASHTLTQLNNLIEESLQIYELENQKTNTVEDLYNSLKIITEFLSFSVKIHPRIFNLPADSNITLLPNLDISIRLSNGKSETRGINTFSADVIAQILESVVPDILSLMKSEKARLTEQITFLRTATKQLKQLSHLKDDLSAAPTTV